jgi:hypothetical protein
MFAAVYSTGVLAGTIATFVCPAQAAETGLLLSDLSYAVIEREAGEKVT